MLQLPFIKMHGAENDYIFFDGFESPLPPRIEELAPQICQRHSHIGADGIITMRRPADAEADVEMHIWNADGAQAEMCGNGARCIAVWMKQQKRVQDRCRIQTADRIVRAFDIHCTRSGGKATVDMGDARQLSAPEGEEIRLTNDRTVSIHRINIGNPHAVLRTDELSVELVREFGPQIECHPSQTERTNVHFVRTLGPQQFQARVWERGSGETRACGSGACAILAALTHAGVVRRGDTCSICMPGGELKVQWPLNSGILLGGPVVIAFSGSLNVPVSSSQQYETNDAGRTDSASQP